MSAPPRLSAPAIDAFVQTHPGWLHTAHAIEKTWRFADFHRTMSFVNAVAGVAHRLDHHPELVVSHSRCTVRWHTHDAGGVSTRDFAAAEAVDALPEAAATALPRV
ncbi:MAG: 4a-hydroxytetrahydrobiopterin dehydratase [Pseudomonadota bacterium]|nr:4a-hydroxytetrahydrobiopterin dehydratase [Pseudomonadota bacterium]